MRPKPTTRLRSLLEPVLEPSSASHAPVRARSPIRAIGAHNGLTAKLAQEAGFEAIWASGLEISAAAGVPDANILSMSEVLAAAEEMSRATDLPIICDCDTGFGNSQNVIHMVRRYEAAGMAAVCIEDKLFPKVNSFVPGRQELAPVAEFVGKIIAAKSTQIDPDFVVIARVEALIAGWGEDEALHRAEAYRRAGADAILIHSKQETPGEILSFLERWRGRSPVVVVPTTYPQLSATELKAAGADIVIYANHGLRASIRAVTETFGKIARDGSTQEAEADLVPLARVFELQGMSRFKEDEKRFLRTGDRQVRVVIPAAGDLAVPEDLRAVVGKDIPRALLDLYGKPLLQRQVETLAQVGIQDVAVVGSLELPELATGHVRTVPAEGSGMVSSIAAGLKQMPPPSGGTTLICFSDILFSGDLIKNLVECHAPISILVDTAFREDPQRAKKKALTLVACDDEPAAGSRRLETRQEHRVSKIGKALPPEDAHFEFIGFLALDEAGHKSFLDYYERWGREFADRRFESAARFEEASITDFLMAMIRDGQVVTAVEQHRGWLEIHDFEDYRAAIEQLSRK